MDSSQEDSGYSSGLSRLFSQAPVVFQQDPQSSETPPPSLTILPSKTFNDPIHGLIDVEYMLVKLIDTPYVQRLRFLNQLGAGSYVFPGAAHNRFQHSLGTMHLCGQMAEALRHTDLTGTISADLTDKVILLIKVAGLFHDTGHGPLSHCFDGLFIPKLIETTNDEELRKALQGWEHEDTSERMVHAAIHSTGLTDPELYLDYITDDEITYIQQLINPPDDISKRVFPHLGYTYDIVSNSRCSVDVDKFDYLERDSFHAGLRSAFRAEQLIKNCKAINGQIAFNKKIAFEVYQLFQARYSLFKQVYSHRKVKSVEFMITDAMMLADPVLEIGRKVLNLDDYVKLNDSIVQIIEFYPLDTIQNPKHRKDMAKAQEILNRLRWRDLYKYCAESLLAHGSDPAKVKKINEQLVYNILKKDYPKTQLTVEDIVLQKMTLNYALKDKNPVDNVLFYNSLTDTDARTIPREKVSLLIPHTFSEQYIRIFIKINDPEEKRRAAVSLDKCLRQNLDPKSGLHSLDQKDLEDNMDNNNNNDSTGSVGPIGSNNGSTRLQGYSSQHYMSQNGNNNNNSTMSQKPLALARLGVTNANSTILHRTATQQQHNMSSHYSQQIASDSPHRLTSTASNKVSPATRMMKSSNQQGIQSHHHTNNNSTSDINNFSTDGLSTPQKRMRAQISTMSTPLLPDVREERSAFDSENDDSDDDLVFSTEIDSQLRHTQQDRSQNTNTNIISSQSSMRSNISRISAAASTASKATGGNKKQKANSMAPAVDGQKTLMSYFGGDKNKAVKK